MSSSNILSLPFRKGTHLSLASTIRHYIDTKYDQHPDMFRHDLEVIDSLRRDAVNIREPHPSGIAKLQAYAGQLVWIGGKFPIDIGAEFTWYPALGYNTERPMVRNNLKYELMNILYNLSSLYSQLAINTPRGNTDGLKTAANYFALGAGVLKHMAEEVLPELRMSDPPEDMDVHTLESLTNLLLAQSQECFWQKAVMDGYKDATIAKLAARVSDLYNSAGDAAVKSEAISSAWIHHMTAKHHHFAGAAQYRQACHCLEKRKYGEEVARLMDAAACVTEGLRQAKGGNLNRMVMDDLQGLKRKVEEDLKRAEKDNDMIFLNPVPPKSELALLERANMAIAKVPPQIANPYDFLGDHAEFGPALFSKLVPFSVHVATTIYEQKRDHTVNQEIIGELEAMTTKMHELLSSLGLPGSLQALEKPLGLPPSLVQHAEEIRQADAVTRLQKSFADIDKLRTSDLAIFEDGKSSLSAEEEEDQRLRSKYGTDRWSRPESRADAQGSRYWALEAEIEGYFQSSISSDNIVREKYAGVADLLSLLGGSDRGLANFVPSARSMGASDELRSAIGRVRSAYNDVTRMESRRRKKVETIRQDAKRDDIKSDIMKEAARLERTYPTTQLVPAHFEDFFEKRLARLYDQDREIVAKEEQEQERLLTVVERANQEFEAQKRHVGDRGSKEREQALQKLDDAYFKYKEIINNLDVGRKFYNDLNQIVGHNFRDAVKGWVSQRRMEARALEEELSMPPLSNLNLSRNHTPLHSPRANASYGDQHQHYFAGSHQPPLQSSYQTDSIPPSSHAQPAPQASMAPPVQSWTNSAGLPVQQPQPLAPPPSNSIGATWNPSKGIKFGDAGQNQQAGGPITSPGQRPSNGTWNPGSGIKFG